MIRRADQKGSYTRMDWLNGYFLTLAWNVDSGKYETVRRIDGKKVCFTEKTKPYADDSAVLGAIRLFIEKQIEESGSFPPEEMVFLGVDGPFSDTADELIGRFYKERNEAYFSVMSEYAGAETCARIMDQAYEEGQETFFAILADLPELARKKKEIADKAAKNGDIEFFAIASDGMSDGELSRYAQAAYDSDNFELFVLTCQGLDEAQAAAIEEQAYADGRFEYLFALEE